MSISDCESLTDLGILNAYEYIAIMQNPQLFLGKLRNEHLFYKRSTEHHSHTVPVKVIFLKYPTLNIDDKTKQLFESEIKKKTLGVKNQRAMQLLQWCWK